jgi:hypothetical protein
VYTYPVPNVTISIEKEILEASRAYAKRHGLSLNALIRKMLEQRVLSTSKSWLDECFDLMDSAGGDSKGETWNRDELYDR